MTADTLFAFIATKTTYANVVPDRARNQEDFNRRVSLAFKGNQGQQLQVGRISFFPLSKAVPGHLLCDGGEVSKTAFPELYSYLGDTQGTATDSANFKLPDIRNFAFSATVPVQTVDQGGTVSTGGTVTEPTEPGETGGSVGGNIPSGGKPIDFSINLGGFIP